MLDCYKDNWVTMCIDEMKSVLHIVWHDDGTLTAQQYKAHLLTAKQLAERYKPIKSFNDARKFKLAISPELQIWISENIFQKKGQEIIKRYAFVVSDSVFAQISIEQMMEESERESMSRYFDNVQAAEVWLGIL